LRSLHGETLLSSLLGLRHHPNTVSPALKRWAIVTKVKSMSRAFATKIMR
jgi:hypothetical protein